METNLLQILIEKKNHPLNIQILFIICPYNGVEEKNYVFPRRFPMRMVAVETISSIGSKVLSVMMVRSDALHKSP